MERLRDTKFCFSFRIETISYAQRSSLFSNRAILTLKGWLKALQKLLSSITLLFDMLLDSLSSLFVHSFLIFLSFGAASHKTMYGLLPYQSFLILKLQVYPY